MLNYQLLFKKNLYWLALLGCLWSYSSIANHRPCVLAQKIIHTIKMPTNFQATFRYTIQENNIEDFQEILGEVWIKKNKYRISLKDNILTNDGKTLWDYRPDSQELYIYNGKLEKTSILASPIQLLNLYKKEFIPISLHTKVLEKITYHVIELVAKDKDFFIQHLILQVSQKDHQIKYIKALENDGIAHSFTLTDLNTDTDWKDSFFEFDVKNYKDVEIIDLR